MNVGEAGVAFYIPTNKYSENNSDNANVQVKNQIWNIWSEKHRLKKQTT